MRIIKLTQGKYTIIDGEDYERVSKFKWCASKVQNNFYATRSDHKNNKTIRLHRFIMNITNPKIVIDHINCNSLDNRKYNLRLCSHQQNLCNRGEMKNNTSGYKGVYWNKHAKKHFSSIRFNGKNIHLGYFEDPKEAYEIYCKKAKELHGEFFHG